MLTNQTKHNIFFNKIIYPKPWVNQCKKMDDLIGKLECMKVSDKCKKQEKLKDLITKNEYIKRCSSNKNKDFNSLSFLVKKPMSQSDCIKIGTGLEQVFKDIVLNETSFVNIKPKNTKGNKEKDHLFMDNDKKIIFYAELKSNLNLDTEKCKSTSDKCSMIEQQLKEEYPDFLIKMFLVGSRYYDKSLIPKGILSKYTSISSNVVGINNYFSELSVDLLFDDEEDYSTFLNNVVDQMFEKDQPPEINQ